VATNVATEVTGSVWEVVVEVGASVAQGDTLMIIESMKMEIPVEAPRAGAVQEIRFVKGDAVEEGQVVVVLG
jgi:biotin carboxyl carrier protein